MDERLFRRVDKFDGMNGTWKEWSFQFKTQVGAASRFARDKFDEIQKAAGDPDWDTIFVADKDEIADKLGWSCTVR